MRRLIAQRFQVSGQSDFALLGHIGGECAGAVTFLEPGQALPVPTRNDDVQWLSDQEVVAILDELPRRPMLAGKDGLRLSLAGAQDKLPVVFDGARIGLPRNGTPSSHILKPAIHAVQDSVSNEGFCMALAEAMQLKPAKSKVHLVLDRSFLLVERYEQEHHSISFPDPIEAIRFRMEQEGLRQKDLAKYFPGKNRVSEVLNHKRPLSLGMIRSLHNGLGIPAHVLLQECTA
jgi:antitoxin component HigA of HigAB toxin-antitoxin module